jgi:hypothetical protein
MRTLIIKTTILSLLFIGCGKSNNTIKQISQIKICPHAAQEKPAT